MAVTGPRTVDVLVLRALGLGDLLTALPALRGLRRGLPGRIVLAAPAGLAPLALHTGVVDEVVHTVPLAPLPGRLHGAGLAVNLHGCGPQSTARLRETHPERLLSYGLPGAPDWDDTEHERQRWCRLVATLGVRTEPDDLDLHPPVIAPIRRQAVLVHPGAAFGSRRWPGARWAQVAGQLAAGGEQVLVTGSAAEWQLCEWVAIHAGLGTESVVAGRTSLLELVSLVAASRLLLSGDTGIAHIATAVGTPSVVLFGPASPTRWRPPPGRTRHRILWSGHPGELFAEEPDAGLVELSTAQVLAEATALLHRLFEQNALAG